MKTSEVQSEAPSAQRHSVMLHLSRLADHFNQLCPSGRGYIASEDVTYGELTAGAYTGTSPAAVLS